MISQNPPQTYLQASPRSSTIIWDTYSAPNAKPLWKYERRMQFLHNSALRVPFWQPTVRPVAIKLQSCQFLVFSVRTFHMKHSFYNTIECGSVVMLFLQIVHKTNLIARTEILIRYAHSFLVGSKWMNRYGDVIMGTIASQITSLTIVYATVYSDADQRKHQSSASLAFVWGIHRGPMNSPHKWPVTRKMFPFDDVIMVMHFVPHRRP